MNKTVSTIAAEMADREAIRECLYRYCRGIDRVDAELMRSAFWPDATDEHGNFDATSAQDFVDHAVPILQAMDQTQHFMGNILIDIVGDTAYVESYVRAIHRMRRPSGEPYDHLSAARYVDRMERRDDEWRIKSRAVVRDWFRAFPDAAEWEENIFGSSLEIGKRMPDDRSYNVLKHTHKA